MKGQYREEWFSKHCARLVKAKTSLNQVLPSFAVPMIRRALNLSALPCLTLPHPASPCLTLSSSDFLYLTLSRSDLFASPPTVLILCPFTLPCSDPFCLTLLHPSLP